MPKSRPVEEAGQAPDVIDAIIVGAGFAGLYMLHKLREIGISARIYEAGSDVGGTWFWNRYPGARVDVESQEYSYSFSPELEAEWEWTERYAAQPELLKYVNHVADRFDLRRDIRFDTRVASAVYDETRDRWTVTTDTGDTVSARFCIMATGCLSAAKQPDIPGAGSFTGETYSTAIWPEEGVDFSGKRVGVIGTGSSGIQTITTIAPQVAELTIFQRTPNFSVPAQNGPINPEVAADWKANREHYRDLQRKSGAGILQVSPSETLTFDASPDERRRAFEDRWARGGFSLLGAFADVNIDKQANDEAAAFVADKIRSIVDDPDVAEHLIPTTYPVGAKRMCVDTGYYQVFNQDNVALVDLRSTPIQAITPTGIRTTAQDYELDAIVYAIGFDAMTGALDRIDIRGRDGLRLSDKWADGPLTYLGLMVSGFPNLFMITGPGSPSVLANMILAIEQHVDWIADCINHLGTHQLSIIEPTPAAEQDWVAHVNELAAQTLYLQANSWYLGANIPGKPRVFMPYPGGLGLYRETCDDVVANNYHGFTLTGAAQTV
tara:strand:+ start:226 stop:1875 length:1650 start_codon:yes stop_codon:yes gene_type:complete